MFQRQLDAQMRDQIARRGFDVIPEHEIKELRALSLLAHKLWGDCGFVTVDEGIKHLGYFPDGQTARQLPGRPITLERPQVIAFSGASYAEIHAQVRKAQTSTVI